MTTKRIQEAGTLSVDPTTNVLRVCLISEGSGSSANFPREFFTEDNGNRLAEALSFPAHPKDVDHPEHRDPMSAIGSIGKTVTIEEHEGKVGFWSEFIPSPADPRVGPYLREYGNRLGLSVYSDSTGHNDPATGKWVAEALVADDPYRSVDVVVAAGRGGKFEKLSESLGILPKASAPAEEEEVTHMEKDIEDRFAGLETSVGKLTEALEGKAKADLQVTADAEAVEKAVETRLANYGKIEEAVTTAKLTESQAKAIMARAAKGATLEDVQPDIDSAKAVIAETLKLAGIDPDADDFRARRTVVEHLGANDKGDDFNIAVPGFGKVA